MNDESLASFDEVEVFVGLVVVVVVLVEVDICDDVGKDSVFLFLEDLLNIFLGILSISYGLWERGGCYIKRLQLTK